MVAVPGKGQVTLETFYTETFEHRPNQTLLNIILLFYCQLVATNENIPCRHCLHNDNIQSREACSSHNNQYGGRRAIGGNMWDSREIVCHNNMIGKKEQVGSHATIRVQKKSGNGLKLPEMHFIFVISRPTPRQSEPREHPPILV